MTADQLDPGLRRIARVLPRGGFGRRTLPIVRALTAVGVRVVGDKTAEVIRVNEHVSVRLHRPPQADPPLPALLWIHGGGYIMGAAVQDDALCARIAREVGALVASVDYRLAPDSPYPAPLDDCHAALTWLAARDDVDPARIAIGGASAGGGLAAGLVLRAHDEGRIRPAFQLLVYPMLDDRTVLRRPAQLPYRMWSPAANRFGWESYLGCEPGAGGIRDHAAPARRDDLSGLPPAWIGVGSVDLFRDEDIDYAKRLTAAGVPTQLDVVQGAFHGFDAVAGNAAISQKFVAAQIDALRQAFAAQNRGPQ